MIKILYMTNFLDTVLSNFLDTVHFFGHCPISWTPVDLGSFGLTVDD
jgi:hypothetical protein